MNTVSHTTIKLEAGPRRVQRFMVFAVDPTKDDGESLGGFQFDHEDFDYVMTFIEKQVQTTQFSAFEVLDTETFDVHKATINRPVKDTQTYRVVLTGVPEDKRAGVLLYLGGILEVPSREIPLYVQTMPSFVGQRLTLEAATAIQTNLLEFGAHARVEPE